MNLPFSNGVNTWNQKSVQDKSLTFFIYQTDYLRKISLKMLSMETKNQNPAPTNPPSLNPVGGNQSKM